MSQNPPLKMKKLSLKIIVALLLSNEGLSYRELSERTGFHINTVSRHISFLYSKGMIEISQSKSNSIRGKKWVNIAKLSSDLLSYNRPSEFFLRIISKSGCQLSDMV